MFEKSRGFIAECVFRQDVRCWSYNHLGGWFSGDGVRYGRHDGEPLQSHGWEGAGLQLPGWQEREPVQAHLLRYSSHYHYCYSYSYLSNFMAYQVLVNALKAPAHLQYQLAFLSTVSLSPYL